MKQVEQRHVTAPEREFVGVQSYRRDEAIGGSEVERAREPRAIVALVAAGVGGSQLEAWVAHANDHAGLALVLLATSGGQAAQLARQLRLRGPAKIRRVRESARLEANGLYVISSSSSVPSAEHALRSGLELEESETSNRAAIARHRATETEVSNDIDQLLARLSERYRERLIGVLPFGCKLDVRRGLLAVKQQGGMVAVEQAAERDPSLQRLLATVPVDLVLPAQQMLAAIERFVRVKPRLWVTQPAVVGSDEEQRLAEVLDIVRQRTGHDLRSLRPSACLRRVGWRLRHHGMTSFHEYVRLLRREPVEAQHLADQLLNRTTRFFRDRDTFRYLEEHLLPLLFEHADGVVRAWSVGCATGEEAYSLAIVLDEARQRRGVHCDVRVFATDVHEGSLESAREGAFGTQVERDIDELRLQRYFVRDGETYHVRHELRELVVFSHHDLLTDAPLPRMDLILCRNVLASMQPSWKRHASRALARAVRPQGYLILGAGERLEQADAWLVEDREKRIFRRGEPLRMESMVRSDPGELAQSLAALHRELVESLAPPSLLIDAEDRVVHASTDAAQYLAHPTGEPSTELVRLLPWPLQIEVKAGLEEARSQRIAVRIRPTRVSVHGRSVQLGVELRPATGDRLGFVLLSFDERVEVEPTLPEGSGTRRVSAKIHQQEIETERHVAARRLATMVERYETNQEALRARNEELNSVNQELTAALQELELAQRELYEASSELEAQTREYRCRIAELEQFSNDLSNLLEATGIATLFLDGQSRILRFTPRLTALFNLKGSDQGRPLTDLTHRLGYPELPDDVSAVLKRRTAIEREVQCEGGEWYLTRLLPYRTPEDRFGGVVVTFIGITARKRVEDELRQAKEYAEHIISALPQPLLVLTSEFLVSSANSAFYEYSGLDRERTLGRPFYELCGGQWDVAELRTLLEEVLLGGESFAGYQLERKVSGRQRCVFLMNARRLGSLPLILLGMSDITARHDVERVLRRSESKYRALSELSPQAIFVVLGERYVYANQRAAALLGVEHPHELIGRLVLEVPESGLGELIASHVQRVSDAAAPKPSQQRACLRLAGNRVELEIVAGTVEWEGSTAVQVLAHEASDA